MRRSIQKTVLRARSIVIGLGGAIALVVLIQYLITNSLATKGSDLAVLIREETELRTRQQRLAFEVAQLSSLTRVYELAVAGGFTDAKVYATIGSSGLALNQRIIAQR